MHPGLGTGSSIAQESLSGVYNYSENYDFRNSCRNKKKRPIGPYPLKIQHFRQFTSYFGKIQKRRILLIYVLNGLFLFRFLFLYQ